MSLFDDTETKQDNNKKTELHSTTQRIDAVHNNTPYKKEKLPFPNCKSQVHIACKEYLEWPRFYQPKSLPDSSDWLHAFPSEKSGQTFNAFYKHIKHSKLYSILTNPNKNSIGLITCGSFNLYIGKQLYPLFDILSEITRVYYFGINIDILQPMSAQNITSRYNASSNNNQLQTGSIERRLKTVKRKHKNLCCLMGISVMDLYPLDSWNFVFGEACMSDMVGIFSFARYFPGFYKLDQLKYGLKNTKLQNLKAMIDGEMVSDDKHWLNNVLNGKEQTLFIRRCIGVLVHEIGHLFGLNHCPYFECCMNGANHLIESDRAPLHLCPVCLHKMYFVSLMMEQTLKQKRNKDVRYLDILTRYQQLSVLYAQYGLTAESKWCAKRSQFIMSSVVSLKEKQKYEKENVIQPRVINERKQETKEDKSESDEENDLDPNNFGYEFV